MNHLTDHFGRLSTSAQEWKPSDPQNENASSDLNASSVKEFVPGQGWNTSTSTTAVVGQQPAEEAYNEVELEQTTIPASTAEPPPHRSLLSLGLSDDIWRYHRELALECLRQMAPQDPRHKAIPPPYTNPFCLDDLHPTNNHNKHTSTSLGGQTYQVVNRDDGFLYCLRRFENIRSVSNPLCQQVLDRWNVNGISDHPGILNLEQCFVAQRALFVVHAYQPGATSLSHSQWQQRSSHGQGGIQCMPEPIVWSCVVQLVSILRRIHSLNLAVRCLDAAHVLVSMDASQLRFRFHVNCVGVMDLLDASNNSRKSMADHQWDDLRSLGRLLLGLATATKIHSSNEERRAEQYLQQRCSPELQELILTLCQSPHPPTAMELARALAGRALDELDAVHLSLDRTQQQLRGEYESGRAMRLLLKLGMVNERPELGMNRRWASSGDAYLLSLFRDYVFHQADGAGNPVLDLGHIVTSLNKLDAADEEQMVLASRDGKTLMVVSFADVARALEQAYQELLNSSVNVNVAAAGGGALPY